MFFKLVLEIKGIEIERFCKYGDETSN